MRYLNVILLGGLLCAPAVLSAQDRDRDRTVTERTTTTTQRYYDPYTKKYHDWNENEQKAWEHWVRDEHHKTAHDFAKANKREQRDYWKWRKEHSDWH